FPHPGQPVRRRRRSAPVRGCSAHPGRGNVARVALQPRPAADECDRGGCPSAGPSGPAGALDRANKYVSRAESVRRFEILSEDFTLDDYLTPKLSVKRNLVLRDFAATIDDLYAKAAAERASERASGQ